MAKKIIKIAIWVIASVLILACVLSLIARLIFMLPVSEYYANSKKAFFIPGTHEGYVAQGLTYDERSDSFFLTGYMTDSAASPLYIVERESGKTLKRLTMLTEENKTFTGHSGGIAVSGNYIYIAGSSKRCVYVYSYNDAINAEDGGVLSCLGSFYTKSENDYVRVSFVEAIDGKLYVGEYYNDGYSTPDSHKMTTYDGSYHQAIIVEYNIDNEAEFGISPTPSKVYSIRDKVQGMTVYNGKMYLSSSAGTETSIIDAYDLSSATLAGNVTNILDTELPLYYLDTQSRVEEYRLPPMAEEIAIVDGMLYTMCESASNKYLFGKLYSAEWCYATDLSKYRK